MKSGIKNIFLLLLVSAVFGTCLQEAAAQVKEGKITYSLDVEGEGAFLLKSLLPGGYEYLFKSDKVYMKTVNGMFASAILGDFLYHSSSSTLYMVKREEKVAYIVTNVKGKQDKSETDWEKDVTVTATDQYQDIAGFKCRKHIVKSKNTVHNPTDQELWVTEEIQANLNDVIPIQLGQFKGLKGVPMKIRTREPRTGHIITITATGFQKSLPTEALALFDIPADFEVKQAPKDMPTGFGF